MARSTTIRLPGTDGPDIVIERGAFSKPRVRVDGSEIPRDPARKDTYAIVTPDGTPRAFRLKSTRNGLVAIADDGSQFALDPPRPLWETVLALLPVGLVAVGGLLGGAFGGAAAAGNIAISRSSLQTPVRIGAMAGVTVLAALAWFALAYLAATALNPIPSYATGECVHGTLTGETTDSDTIRTVPCADPHRGEVVGVHTVADTAGVATFPGMSAISTTANDRCLPLFGEYVGIDFNASSLEMFYVYPSEETWARGDREIACIATASAGEVLTGSVAGTAR